MPFATKQNKKIKFQGSLETLRYLNKTLYWLPPPPILGRSIVLNDLKKKRKKKRKEEENSQFIGVHKRDLGG